MNAFFSAITVYGLYGMTSIPFIVWAGRSAYTGTRASRAERAWPGISSTIFRIVLPLLLIFLYAWNASGTADASEWMPYQFLLLPPALGSIAGYGIGFFIGKRTKN
ncbi:hypothetical protein [Phyllobacterium sp. YR531]|uniref:hypothetical protein n=1 Tax=Phyllobacterium sp. YR531 TaxID=1144343 RepID=UPI000593B104|nr:hypothetical protein [Phyllobacterium sp. YR531]